LRSSSTAVLCRLDGDPSFSWLGAIFSIVSPAHRSEVRGDDFQLAAMLGLVRFDCSSRLQQGGVVRQHNDSQQSYHLERTSKENDQGE
jgi:hypothetical protein